jgi:hypothetical protein
LNVKDFITELKEKTMDLISKAVDAGENPENEINFHVQNAKDNLAALLVYYAKELQGGDGLAKLLTHPALYGFAENMLKSKKSSSLN